MKYLLSTVFFALVMCAAMSFSPEEKAHFSNTIEKQGNGSHYSIKSNKMKIIIGSKTFTATLVDNETARAFKARLPMTITMEELNGNEKKFDLPEDLPGRAANPGTIHAGDLMVYSSSTIVLFYKTFPTRYSYSRLGHLDSISGLIEALGSRNSKVTFKLQDEE